MTLLRTIYSGGIRPNDKLNGFLARLILMLLSFLHSGHSDFISVFPKPFYIFLQAFTSFALLYKFLHPFTSLDSFYILLHHFTSFHIIKAPTVSILYRIQFSYYKESNLFLDEENPTPSMLHSASTASGLFWLRFFRFCSLMAKFFCPS